MNESYKKKAKHFRIWLVVAGTGLTRYACWTSKESLYIEAPPVKPCDFIAK